MKTTNQRREPKKEVRSIKMIQVTLSGALDKDLVRIRDVMTGALQVRGFKITEHNEDPFMKTFYVEETPKKEKPSTVDTVYHRPLPPSGGEVPSRPKTLRIDRIKPVHVSLEHKNMVFYPWQEMSVKEMLEIIMDHAELEEGTHALVMRGETLGTIIVSKVHVFGQILGVPKNA